jgi:hypothetical protein
MVSMVVWGRSPAVGSKTSCMLRQASPTYKKRSENRYPNLDVRLCLPIALVYEVLLQASRPASLDPLPATFTAWVEGV